MAEDPLDRIKPDALIEATHSIPLKIDRDVLIPDGANFPDDSGTTFGLERARQFLRGDLESRQRRWRSIGVIGFELVVTDAKHAKSERPQHVLGLLDRTQFFASDL